MPLPGSVAGCASAVRWENISCTVSFDVATDVEVFFCGFPDIVARYFAHSLIPVRVRLSRSALEPTHSASVSQGAFIFLQLGVLVASLCGLDVFIFSVKSGFAVFQRISLFFTFILSLDR